YKQRKSSRVNWRRGRPDLSGSNKTVAERGSPRTPTTSTEPERLPETKARIIRKKGRVGVSPLGEKVTVDERHVGVEVSKPWLDFAVLETGEAFRCENSEAGIAGVLERLRALTPKLVVLEASGGYELEFAAVLSSHRMPVAVVNPRQVRDFAKAMGILAKTD